MYGRKYNDAIKVKISDLFLYYLSATTPPYRNQCAVMSRHICMCLTSHVARQIAWHGRDGHVKSVTSVTDTWIVWLNVCLTTRNIPVSYREQINDLVKNFFVGWICLSWSLFRWSSSTIYMHSYVCQPYSKSYNLVTGLFILSIFCFSFN